EHGGEKADGNCAVETGDGTRARCHSEGECQRQRDDGGRQAAEDITAQVRGPVAGAEGRDNRGGEKTEDAFLLPYRQRFGFSGQGASPLDARRSGRSAPRIPCVRSRVHSNSERMTRDAKRAVRRRTARDTARGAARPY